MAFLRFTRDRRGYENTFLLHSSQPGERPRILYWYRSAPDVRVGRPALDEDAIRTIEEQHPQVDFDWPQILEVGAITQPEVERRPLRAKRRPSRPPQPPPLTDQAVGESGRAEPEDSLPAEQPVLAAEEDPSVMDDTGEDAEEVVPVRARNLLEELVGHEIATRLRARHSEIIARVHGLPGDHAQRNAWKARAEALNPDNWVTPDEVLNGVAHADGMFDALRRELLAH